MKTKCFLTKFLYTDEINEIGKKNKFKKKFLGGAFPADINPENFFPVLLDMEYRRTK